MIKLFFLVNSMSDFDFADLLDKHLPGCAVYAGTMLPPDTDHYDLIVLWNYRRKVALTGSKRNVVLFHGSGLPDGRGFAPIYNTFARSLPRYVISGIFAADEIDQGDVIVRASFSLRDNHVADDVRRWDTELSIMLTAQLVLRLEQGPLSGRKQQGEASWYARRRPQDNEIDIRLSFAELIPHLRACEDQHPAFFMLGDTKYLVSISAEHAPAFPDDLEIEFLDGR